jgi:hypothetical protein
VFLAACGRPSSEAQTNPEKKHLSGYGLDLVKGELKNNLGEGVLEPALSKARPYHGLPLVHFSAQPMPF